MQMLEDRGMLSLPPGRRIVAIFLFEDVSIVPLLALVAFLAPGGAETTLGDRALSILIGLASIAALVAAGRWLLNPMFRINSLPGVVRVRPPGVAHRVPADLWPAGPARC
jgi:glutathione-regulated potassium-efflux system protein KefB